MQKIDCVANSSNNKNRRGENGKDMQDFCK